MTARTATIAGLLTGAAGLVILMIAGAEMPAVPPGLILLVIAAVLVATVRRRWTAIVAVLIGVAELAGQFASGSGADLVDPSPFGLFAGGWVRLIGSVVAVAAGIALARQPSTGTKTEATDDGQSPSSRDFSR